MDKVIEEEVTARKKKSAIIIATVIIVVLVVAVLLLRASLKSIISKAGFRNVKVFAEARDLGIIWAANKHGYNPDWLPGTDRPLTTYTLGLNVSF